ncbi:hypothetical protein DERP_003664 [Dermatophagoides pteronyssinus]|uniref:Uncharacterized protein n=1 Tax=Dermatophagoides pteronyssinus TaxID=6956 RepID=A0ABQ8JLZ8_DERPT|nr:hypothetical protein DERP_003664 [Dermatophagoides pteronyssinus]
MFKTSVVVLAVVPRWSKILMPGKTKIVTEFRRFQAMFVVEGTIPATVTPVTDSDHCNSNKNNKCKT